jgi:hypothetical protein
MLFVNINIYEFGNIIYIVKNYLKKCHMYNMGACVGGWVRGWHNMGAGWLVRMWLTPLNK